jgi:hypothetical protein
MKKTNCNIRLRWMEIFLENIVQCNVMGELLMTNPINRMMHIGILHMDKNLPKLIYMGLL